MTAPNEGTQATLKTDRTIETMSQTNESINTTTSFFTDNSDRSLLDEYETPPSMTPASQESRDSTGSDPFPTARLPLSHFFSLMTNFPSLKLAHIVSAECYRQRSVLGAPQRFLVLRLRRRDQSDTYLRLDRQRSQSTRVLGIFGKSNEGRIADDTVVTARIIEDLFENRAGTLENRVEFSSPVTLGLLRTLLIIICEELAQYDTWPENGFVFYSLILEHLVETGAGHYTKSNALPINYPKDIRLRIERRFYCLPAPPPTILKTLDLLKPYCTGRYPQPKLLQQINAASRLVRKYEAGPSLDRELLVLGRHLDTIIQSYNVLPSSAPTLLLAIHVVRLYRKLWQRDPSKNLRLLAASIDRKDNLLLYHGQFSDACWSALELVLLWKEALHGGIVSGQSDLAITLKKYADRLTRVGRNEEACEVFAEAAGACRQEVVKGTMMPADLASILLPYITQLSGTGRHLKAYAAMREMVPIQRALDQKQEALKPWWRPQYPYLDDYASMCSRLGHYDEACSVALEIVEVRRRFYQTKSWESCSQLLDALSKYAVHLVRAERPAEARTTMMDGESICGAAYKFHHAPEIMDLGVMFTQYANEFATIHISDVKPATEMASTALRDQMRRIRTSPQMHDHLFPEHEGGCG